MHYKEYPSAYTSLEGATVCDQCVGSGEPGEGFWWSEEADGSGTCNVCPEFAVCAGGRRVAVPIDGYWSNRGSSESDWPKHVYKCEAAANW